MDVKEKLVEIVKRAAHLCLPSNTKDFHLDMFVTDLIAHGVTVQEWISVKDRLPEQFVNVLCYFPKKEYGSKVEIDYAETTNGYFSCSFKWGRPTHWMPLPQPPKGE